MQIYQVGSRYGADTCTFFENDNKKKLMDVLGFFTRTKQWPKVKRCSTSHFRSGRGVCSSSRWSSPKRPRRRKRIATRSSAVVTRPARCAVRSTSGRSWSTSSCRTPPSSPSDSCSSSTTKSSATWTSSSPVRTLWSSSSSSTGSSSSRPKNAKSYATPTPEVT